MEASSSNQRVVIEYSVPKKDMVGAEILPTPDDLNVADIAEQRGTLGIEEAQTMKQNVSDRLLSHSSLMK